MSLLDSWPPGQVYCIHSQNFPRFPYHKRLRDLLKKLRRVSRQRADIDKILTRVASGDTQLWCVNDERGLAGVAITEVFTSPKEKYVTIPWIAGSGILKHTNQFLGILEEWARSIGASAIETHARIGWRKILPKEYKEDIIIHRKEL